MRELVQWLRSHITVTSGGAPSHTVKQFLDAIRAAAKNAQQAVSSPPSSPPAGAQFLLDSSPPAMLSVPGTLLPDYVRAIARLYVIELRPMWRPNWLGQKHGCAGTDLLSAPEEGNRVLLAKLTLIVGPDALNADVWNVQAPVEVDESARPFLLQIRLLEELLLVGPGGGGGPASGAPTVVAAGVVAVDGAPNTRLAFNNLRLTSPGLAGASGLLTIEFDGYRPPAATGGPQLIVKAMPWASGPDVMVAVIYLSVTGILFFGAVELAEGVLTPWHVSQHGSRPA